MAEAFVRALAILLAAGVAVAVGMTAKRKRRALQPKADISMVDTDAALVAFTSTECENCKQLMGLLAELGVGVREIAHEREPALFEAAGVGAVPLIVVRRPDGSHAGQLAGIVRRRAVTRALARGGW
jgi:hypothetical protein